MGRVVNFIDMDNDGQEDASAGVAAVNTIWGSCPVRTSSLGAFEQNKMSQSDAKALRHPSTLTLFRHPRTNGLQSSSSEESSSESSSSEESSSESSSCRWNRLQNLRHRRDRLENCFVIRRIIT